MEPGALRHGTGAGIAIVGIGVVLVLLQAIVDGVRNFSDDLPALVEKARHATSVV